MKTKILSLPSISEKCIYMLKNERIYEKDFNGISDHSKAFETDYHALISLLESTDERYQLTGVGYLMQYYFRIFGPCNHIENNRIISVSHSSLLAKRNLGNNVEIFDELYTTTEPMEDGILFEWRGEPMCIVDNSAYAILSMPHYRYYEYFEAYPSSLFVNSSTALIRNFECFEEEPAYVFGKVPQKLIDHVRENSIE